MEIKEYNDFLIREDGLVLNSKTNKMIKGHIHKYGDVVVNGEKLKNVVARLFFDFDINFQNRIKVGHLDHNKQNNNIENLKIYNRNDKFNKSGKYVVLFGGEFLFFNRKGFVSKHKDLRTAFYNIS